MIPWVRLWISDWVASDKELLYIYSTLNVESIEDMRMSVLKNTYETWDGNIFFFYFSSERNGIFFLVDSPHHTMRRTRRQNHRSARKSSSSSSNAEALEKFKAADIVKGTVKVCFFSLIDRDVIARAVDSLRSNITGRERFWGFHNDCTKCRWFMSQKRVFFFDTIERRFGLRQDYENRIRLG